MKRVFLCLSHQTHLLKEHLIKLKLIYITFWFDGKFYSRTCSGVDLLSGVHTTGCQPLHLLSRTVNEGIDWIRDPLAESHDTSGLYPETVNEVNDWVKVPLAERLSNNGGQTIERSRRAMHFRGIRGGSTGSLLCNAILRLRRRKRKTNRFGFVPNKRWRFPIRVVHFQSYSIEGQSVSCIAGKCVSAN